jgi:hypothetical protein
MLKTFSAALIAASLLAAPAIAATSGKTNEAGTTKSATVTKSAQVKKNPLNANAKVGERHHHVRHHNRHRAKMSVGKTYNSAKVAAKHVKHPAKHG